MSAGITVVTNEDCMELMARYPDKYFDLAIVDPPYGIDAANMQMGNGKKDWVKKDWDNAVPDEEYFSELFRVSKNQIVFGGCYFTDKLPVSRCWLSWNKIVPTGMSFADLELAWCSFDQVAREIRIGNAGNTGNQTKGVSKIHPTQKPVKLYKWLLTNYAKEGDKILDTHLGSGSSRIAAHDLGFDFTACELDKEYFAAQEKRFIEHVTRATELMELGYAKSELNKNNPTLF